MNTAKNKNALWFFIALLIGGLSIWYTKAQFENQWYAAIVAGFVVIALTFYYAFNDVDAPEEEGDNVYYLGLLFTLISLIFALVELFGADAVEDSNAEQVRTLLENFGIALTSTIFGIVGRIIVQNWQAPTPGWSFFKRNEVTRQFTHTVDRSQPSDNEQFDPIDYPKPPSQDSSADDLERFNRHILGMIARDLSQGANALARFHTIVRRHASDVQEQLYAQSKSLQSESASFKEALQKDAEDFIAELKTMSEESLNALTLNFTSVTKRAKELQERTHDMQERYIEDSATMFETFHDALKISSEEILDEFKRNSNLHTDQIRSNIDVLSQINAEFNLFSNSLQSTNRAYAGYRTAMQEVTALTSSIAPILKKFNNEIEILRDGFDDFLSVFESMQEINLRIGTAFDLERSASSIQDIAISLKDIEQTSRSVPDQFGETALLIRKFSESVESASNATESATDALLKLAERTSMQLDAMKEPRRSFFSRILRKHR